MFAKLDCSPYSRETELEDIITNYLDLFFKIKQLRISNDIPELYTSQCAVKLDADSKKGSNHRPTEDSSFSLRDGAVTATFSLKTSFPEDNWFGIFFRADPLYPTFASYLAYVRQDGSLEVAIFPGRTQAYEIIKRSPSPNPALSSGLETMVIEFENDYLDIQVGERRLTTQKLSFQNAGRIYFGAWQANVELKGAEIICRDTINIP